MDATEETVCDLGRIEVSGSGIGTDSRISCELAKRSDMKGSSWSGEVGISAQSQGPRLLSASCRDAMLIKSLVPTPPDYKEPAEGTAGSSGQGRSGQRRILSLKEVGYWLERNIAIGTKGKLG